VPEGVTDAIATLFEPLGIALRAVTIGDIASANLLVTGCGPIGLLAIAVARRFGARHIYASDICPERLALAQNLGADVAVNVAKAKLAAILPSRSGSDAIDIAIDTSGNAGAIAEALTLVITGGRLVLAGLPEQAVPLDLTRHVILREVAIHGIYGRRH